MEKTSNLLQTSPSTLQCLPQLSFHRAEKAQIDALHEFNVGYLETTRQLGWNPPTITRFLIMEKQKRTRKIRACNQKLSRRAQRQMFSVDLWNELSAREFSWLIGIGNIGSKRATNAYADTISTLLKAGTLPTSWSETLWRSINMGQEKYGLGTS